MAEHIWTVLCDSVIVDKATNKMSLFNVIEGLTVLDPDRELRSATAKDNMAVRSSMALASFWMRSDGDKPEAGEARVVFVGPGGKELATNVLSLELLLEKQAMRTTMLIEGLMLHGPGLYRFVVRVNRGTKKRPRWTVLAKVPLRLTFVDSVGEMPKPALT